MFKFLHACFYNGLFQLEVFFAIVIYVNYIKCSCSIILFTFQKELII